MMLKSGFRVMFGIFVCTATFLALPAVAEVVAGENAWMMMESISVVPSGDGTGLTDTLVIQATLDAVANNAKNETLITLAAGESSVAMVSQATA